MIRSCALPEYVSGNRFRESNQKHGILEQVLTRGYLAEIKCFDLTLARRNYLCFRVDVLGTASTNDQCIVGFLRHEKRPRVMSICIHS